MPYAVSMTTTPTLPATGTRRGQARSRRLAMLLLALYAQLALTLERQQNPYLSHLQLTRNAVYAGVLDRRILDVDAAYRQARIAEAVAYRDTLEDSLAGTDGQP
jgi:hypothetical protein